MKHRPSRIARPIDPKHLKRADNVETGLVGPYLDEIAMALHQSLDSWRYHSGPAADVDLALDALIALWTVAQSRALS